MEKKHNFSFCPECGVKLDGDEMICSVCGCKLAEVKQEIKIETPVAPPPPPATPVCQSCGAKVDPSELFCNNCGARLSMISEQKPVVTPPPPVAEPPVTPPKSETPVAPPPVAETPVVPPPVVEPPVTPPVLGTPVVPPPPVVTEPVKPPVTQTPPPPAVTFCPNCGAKVDGTEVFCNGCGTKLTADTGGTPPPPKTETPVAPPPPVQNVPPPASQPVFQQQPSTEVPKKKKGLGVFLWILIIFFGVIIIGGGTVAFLQYNGSINLPFLAKYIPSKNTTSDNNPPAEVTHYYVMHSFATTGMNRQEAVVSSVIMNKQAYDPKNASENKFKKAVTSQFPNDFYLFTKNVLFKEYKNYDEAQRGRDALIQDYQRKRYNVRMVIVNN